MGKSVDFDPSQTRYAATITAVAVKRGLPPRAATIAIATALQESKLRNLRYGDRDSVGLFQQRPSQGWGTEEQILDPVYAVNRFYDALVKIKGYESMEITEGRPGGAAQRLPRGLRRPRAGGPDPRVDDQRALPCRTRLPTERGRHR